MIKITLSEEERNQLKNARKKRDGNVSERCLYVLLSDEGKSVPGIAKHMIVDYLIRRGIDVSPSTVKRI